MAANMVLIQKPDGKFEFLKSNGTGRAEVVTRAVLAPTYQHDLLSIQDTQEHKAAGVDVSIYQEKTVLIYATKNNIPGDLSVWVEISHDNTDENYIQLGDKKTFNATGKSVITFTTHSVYARVVAQAASADSSNYWTLTTMLLGKT